jgi:hypothetical protein
MKEGKITQFILEWTWNNILKAHSHFNLYEHHCISVSQSILPDRWADRIQIRMSLFCSCPNKITRNSGEDGILKTLRKQQPWISIMVNIKFETYLAELYTPSLIYSNAITLFHETHVHVVSHRYWLLHININLSEPQKREGGRRQEQKSCSPSTHARNGPENRKRHVLHSQQTACYYCGDTAQTILPTLNMFYFTVALISTEPDSSIGIQTGWVREVQFPAEIGIFLFSTASKPALGATKPLCHFQAYIPTKIMHISFTTHLTFLNLITLINSIKRTNYEVVQ